jgi:hypothetical protein
MHNKRNQTVQALLGVAALSLGLGVANPSANACEGHKEGAEGKAGCGGKGGCGGAGGCGGHDKKDEPKKDEPKKDEPKKDEPKKDDKKPAPKKA